LIRAVKKKGSLFSKRAKKGDPLSFNLPGIWISIAGIDLFISCRREKLPERCISATCAVHFSG